ncbi:MAG: antitoxin [Actinomycetota bacterium]|nr:antitoxin [Actinomycetota bacterium]
MATIQVRDIPEDVYETVRRRARAAGQSLQAYMRDQVVRMAGEPTDEELFAEIEQSVKGSGRRIDVAQLLRDIDADRL